MDPDVFMICPNCQLKVEFTHHKDTQRPSALDTDIFMICPICGEKMVKLVSPSFNSIWDLCRRVEDLHRFREYIPRVIEQNHRAVDRLTRSESEQNQEAAK